MPALPRLAVQLAVGMLLAGGLAGGCVQGSLATSTGPALWSAQKTQQAHVGETVLFDFILISRLQNRPLDPYGFADYCMAQIGDDRVQCEPDLNGHFSFEHQLTDVQAGQQIEVTVTAYRQFGSRDFIQVGKKWLHGDSSIDEPDRKVCKSQVTLVVYQVRLEAQLTVGDSPLDPESGKLRLFGPNEQIVSIFIDRPNRPGFALSGPDQAGQYTLVYEPAGNQIAPSGQTKAHFMVYDLAGQQHDFDFLLDTP